MPSWPAAPFPQRVRYVGFGGTLKSTVLETQMDTGPSKRRRRFTTAPEPYTATFVVTTAQLATFVTFFETSTAGGALTFDSLVHPRTGAAATHRFSRPGQSPPKYTRLSDNAWEISVELEVMP